MLFNAVFPYLDVRRKTSSDRSIHCCQLPQCYETQSGRTFFPFEKVAFQEVSPTNGESPKADTPLRAPVSPPRRSLAAKMGCFSPYSAHLKASEIEFGRYKWAGKWLRVGALSPPVCDTRGSGDSKEKGLRIFQRQTLLRPIVIAEE